MVYVLYQRPKMHNLNTEYGLKIKHLRLSYFRSQKLGEELGAEYF